MLIVPLKVIGGMNIETLIKAGSSILGLFVIFAAMGKIVSVKDSKKLKDITKSLIGGCIRPWFIWRSYASCWT